jgi:hypothetical protein
MLCVSFVGKRTQCFLCVSLGRSTFQLLDSLGSRRVYTHVQRLVSVVKMATMLEDFNTEEQSSIVRFFCKQKDIMQRIFIKKCLLR